MFMDGDNMKIFVKLLFLVGLMFLLGSVKGITLQKIIDDTPDGGVIKLDKDYNESINLNKNLIIDLNGHSISGTIINNEVTSSHDECLVNSNIDVKIYEKVINYSNLKADDIVTLNNYLGNDGIVDVLDIKIDAICGDYKVGNVESVSDPIMYKYVIPLSFLNLDDGINRTFNVVKLSNGEIDELDSYYDAEEGTISFKVDTASIYIVTYSDSTLYLNEPKDVSKKEVFPLVGILSSFMYFIIKKPY